MNKIKVGDIVQVAKGKDRGKKGKILRITSAGARAVVEGLNLVKHFRRKTQTDQQGGVVSVESPVGIANLSLLCKSCNRATRVGFKALQDGTRTRFCKSCKEVI